jgi:hypothetical protein
MEKVSGFPLLGRFDLEISGVEGVRGFWTKTKNILMNRKEADDFFRLSAYRQYHNGETIEIDETAEVCHTINESWDKTLEHDETRLSGAWVQAWVFVNDAVELRGV